MAKKKVMSTDPAAAAEPVTATEIAAPKSAAKKAVTKATVKAKDSGKEAKAVKTKAGAAVSAESNVADKKAAAKSEAKKLPIAKKVRASKKPVQDKKKESAKLKPAEAEDGVAKVLDSKVAYEGPLFRVVRDHIIEPGGAESHRDVIRHNGSVVVLAVDHGPDGHGKDEHGKHKHKKHKKNPWIVMERQYRYAAGQYLWELPAGKLDKGEEPVEGAKRELAEETGYAAKKWSPLVEYFASPGFLGESMKVFLAEGLVAGDAHPEEDERIDFRLVKLSDVLELIDEGKIIDGKTLCTALLYARILGVKRKK
jgi:ADP-ribose pyrophosphatase